MRVTLPFFAVELPDDFVVRSEHDPFSAVSESRMCEITVAPRALAEGVDTATAMEHLLEVYREGFRTLATGVRFYPASATSTSERPVRGFYATADDPARAACYLVARAEPVGANVQVVTLSLYQSPDADRGPGPFADLCAAVLASVEVCPEAALVERTIARQGTLDPARLYPFPVTAGYLDELGPDAALALGNGLFLAYAEDNDGAARILFREACVELGVEPEAAAIANLATAVANGAVTIGIADLPDGDRVLVFGPEWLAASCLLLPDLRALAARHLGTDDLCACAPHRDVLFVFPREGRSTPEARRAMLAERAGPGRKPLSLGFFVLVDGGFVPLGTVERARPT